MTAMITPATTAIVVNRQAGAVRSMGEEAVHSLITSAVGAAADLTRTAGLRS